MPRREARGAALDCVAWRDSLREHNDKEPRMKRFVAAILAIGLSFSAVASDTYRWGSQVVSVGDSEGRLRQVAGKPDRETPIETTRGGLQGYRLEYFKGGKSVQVEIVDGRVRSIAQIDS
jgi:hypothetical protein